MVLVKVGMAVWLGVAIIILMQLAAAGIGWLGLKPVMVNGESSSIFIMYLKLYSYTTVYLYTSCSGGSAPNYITLYTHTRSFPGKGTM